MVRQHLAVIKPPYLAAILDGRKQVELRLAKIPLPPYRSIEKGDLIWFKVSRGPIAAWAEADRIEFFDRLTPATMRQLRRRIQPLVLAGDDFWRLRLACRYASLIWLKNVTPLTEPLKLNFAIYSPWLVLKKPLSEIVGGPV